MVTYSPLLLIVKIMLKIHLVQSSNTVLLQPYIITAIRCFIIYLISVKLLCIYQSKKLKTGSVAIQLCYRSLSRNHLFSRKYIELIKFLGVKVLFSILSFKFWIHITIFYFLFFLLLREISYQHYIRYYLLIHVAWKFCNFFSYHWWPHI